MKPTNPARKSTLLSFVPRLVLLLLTALAATVSAQSETVAVPLSDPSQPAFVEAGLVTGSIRVEAYDGDEVLVEVTSDMEPIGGSGEDEKATRGGLRRVRGTGLGLEVEEEDNQVEISTDSWKRAVDLRLRVPRRTSLRLSTVNGGSIAVSGVTGELELSNVNGPIEAVGITGSVVAETINGDVTVRFDTVIPGKAMSFSSLNGDIDVTFPADLSAEFLMRSDMGEILTDFDFEAEPVSRRSQEGGDGEGFRVEIEKEMRAEVGGGGAEIRFKNFNGDILIRKGG